MIGCMNKTLIYEMFQYTKVVITYIDTVTGCLQFLNGTHPKTSRFIQLSYVMALCNGDHIKFSTTVAGFFSSQPSNPSAFSRHLYYIIWSNGYGLYMLWGVSTFACFCVMVGTLLVLKLIYNGGTILPFKFKCNNYCGTINIWG